MISGRIVKSNIRFDSCLAVECVTTDEVYSEDNNGIIRANVNYSFLTSGQVRHTTNEEIAVFTNPNGVECRESDNDSSRNNTNTVATRTTCNEPGESILKSITKGDNIRPGRTIRVNGERHSVLANV